MTTYSGSALNDTIYAGTGPNTIFGDAGDDDLYGNTDIDVIYGGDGSDFVVGGSGNDSLYGEAGNDYQYGQANNDLLSGGDGNDELYGGNNNDTLYGGAGDDWIVGDGSGESGQDQMAGGAGNDTLQGGADSDRYIFSFGYDGRDLVYDNQGDYDSLIISGVSNISQLGITKSGNDVYVYTRADAADGALDEYARIHNYYNGSAYGEGKIEQLTVNGTSYNFQDQISLYWQT